MTTHIRENLLGVRATQDLTGFKYRAVTYGGAVAATAAAAAGLLKYGCNSGYDASVVTDGITKAQIGAAVSTLGFPITITTSGFVIAASSGGLTIGRALSVGNSGDLIEVSVDFTDLSASVV
jgi:hypothetical protein